MNKVPISLDRSERINPRVLNQLKIDTGKDIKDIFADAVESVHGDAITEIVAKFTNAQRAKQIKEHAS